MDEKRKNETARQIAKAIEDERENLAKKIADDIAKSEVTKEYFARSDPKSRLAQLTPKSKDEIIKTGTPEEVAYLFIAVPQKPKQEKEGEFIITDKEAEYARRRMSDEEALQIAKIWEDYDTFTEIERDFKTKFLLFSKEVAVLDIYAKMWAIFERDANMLTRLFNSGSPDRLKDLVDGKTPQQKFKYIDHVAKLMCDTFEGIDLRYEKGFFYLNSSRNSTLMDQIAFRSTSLKDTLTDLKGYIEAIERKLKALGRSSAFLPIDMIILIRDTKNGESIKAHNVPPQYFKSNLNQRIANGEQVTEEEAQKAVFPDYDELILTEEDKKYYDKQIDEYF